MNISEGRIHRITLPELWTESPSSPHKNSRIWERSFENSSYSDLQINYCKKKVAMAPQTEHRFSEILARNPHLITHDEWEVLTTVVYPASDPEVFKLYSAATIDLSGRRVLAFEGTWLVNQTKSYHIAFPSNIYVHTLYYVAPRDLYDQYIDAVQRSFSSIIWKDD